MEVIAVCESDEVVDLARHLNERETECLDALRLNDNLEVVLELVRIFVRKFQTHKDTGSGSNVRRSDEGLQLKLSQIEFWVLYTHMLNSVKNVCSDHHRYC